MVAETMKQAVGVGCHAGRGERDEGTERRGLTLQRHLDEHVAIDVGVKRGVSFNQVARSFDRYG